ncbi:putative gins complex subunit [Phaeomoniella chlamydospora]|uniref:DNA replication complex GINS protein PSF3 n=1 Tax=Phaeomoniella chlamydospora TaxID=158046 RepID=A0A0G2ELD7_PHACM|nr:putative gins complex subunit [Phaeomoniella chlamydospora]
MSYYDVDAILTDAQKVPCTFEITIPNGGYLDGNPGQDMKEGTRVELPLWLATMLSSGILSFTQGQAPISIELPTPLSQRVINALKADPRSVDLRAQASHFYGLAALAFEIFEDEDTVDVLLDTFKSRGALLSDHANNLHGALSGGGEGTEFLRGLDELERKLFRATHDGAKAVGMWIKEGKT